MEARQTPRRRTFIGGKILLNGGASVFDCTVKDLSTGGARLSLDGALAVPSEFELLLSDGRMFHCAVKWRRLNTLGVSTLPKEGS
ncbi:pilus assembly protein PilZ [Rhizobium sp. Root1220]|nr:pilus assembly protein PilZ [Rhizobium sp. Root1220]